MAQWWSIEVLHGEFSAFRWQEQHDSTLIEAALTNGAVDGAWHADRWGVVFEICFDREERWETFCALPAVRAALQEPVLPGFGGSPPATSQPTLHPARQVGVSREPRRLDADKAGQHSSAEGHRLDMRLA